MIERLANSYPIRRAAQLTVYFFHRTKSIIEDANIKSKITQGKHIEESTKKAIQFKNTFTKELKSEWEKIKGK